MRRILFTLAMLAVCRAGPAGTVTNVHEEFSFIQGGNVTRGTETNLYFDVKLNGVPLVWPGHDPHINPRPSPDDLLLNPDLQDPQQIWLPPSGVWQLFGHSYRPPMDEWDQAEIRGRRVSSIEMVNIEQWAIDLDGLFYPSGDLAFMPHEHGQFTGDGATVFLTFDISPPLVSGEPEFAEFDGQPARWFRLKADVGVTNLATGLSDYVYGDTLEFFQLDTLTFDVPMTAEVLARNVDGRGSYLVTVDGPYNTQSFTVFSGDVGGQHYDVTLDGFGWGEREVVFYQEPRSRRLDRRRARDRVRAMAASVPEPGGVVLAGLCVLLVFGFKRGA